jgi:hypothetical protein
MYLQIQSTKKGLDGVRWVSAVGVCELIYHVALVSNQNLGTLVLTCHVYALVLQLGIDIEQLLQVHQTMKKGKKNHCPRQ